MNRFINLVSAIFTSCMSLSCERETPISDLSATDTETTFEPSSGTVPLTVEPEIVEFDEFINYGVPIDVSAVSELGTPTTVVLTESYIERPVFSEEGIKDETISSLKKPNKVE